MKVKIREVILNTFVSASILSADLTDLAKVARLLPEWGVDMLHFDVMDGIFVNNISFGIPVLAALRKKTSLFLDVHLMITDPIRYITQFSQAGADQITVHLESESDPAKTLQAIRANGKKAGLSIKRGTPVEAVYPFLSLVDLILVMSVEPGFGGQGYQPEATGRIRTLRQYLDAHAPHVAIQVDGGINGETAAFAREAGAAQLVTGSYLFGAADPAAAVRQVRGI